MRSPATPLPVWRIRCWQHRRAVRQMWRAYPPGVDALVDRLRATGVLTRFALHQFLLPLYFAREQGWAVSGERSEMAAIMYLRREQRQGIRVLHIDELSVAARYRGHGLAQRLLEFAEELALHEQRPFLKLAVTAANTPAVTLYRRLGYRAQHHRYFTYGPSPAAMPAPTATDVRLRPLRQRQAWEVRQWFSRMEQYATAPTAADVADVADVLVVYYPRGVGQVGMPKVGAHRYAIEYRGQPVGYGDAFGQGSRWHVRLSLCPDVWGTEIERQAIQWLMRAVTSTRGQDELTTFALHVPSAAHFDALGTGPTALASQLGLVEHSYERMIMAKVVMRMS